MSDERRLGESGQFPDGFGAKGFKYPKGEHDHHPQSPGSQMKWLEAEVKRLSILLDDERRKRLIRHNEPKKMPENKFATDVWAIADTLGNLLIKKHQDYGPLNIARSPGGPLNGLRVRMWDKIARINNLTNTGKTPENESLRDSFLDLANYSIIALMVLDGTWPELEETK